MTVDTTGSTFDTLLAVYTGNMVSNLTLVAADDDSGGNFTSKLTFIGVPGTLYYIAVDGSKAATGGVVLHLEQPVPVAPQITLQPLPRTAASGYPAGFSAVATGLPVLGYQWRKNGTNISGATNAAYSLGAVQTNDAANYSLAVSNVLGVTASSNAALTVILPYIFTNLAGSSGAAGATDGVGANARFRGPYGLALDNAGNVYVTENGNHLVRKITPAGLVTTLAGYAQTAGTNDGLGTNARFRSPWGIVAASPTNLYVSDTSNHIIRKMVLSGTNWNVTTLAGLAGTSGSANGTGTAARFNAPRDLTMDSAGNLYVADFGNQLVRKVTPAGVVSTIAGATTIGAIDAAGTSARFNGPAGIDLDAAGNFYIGDLNNRAIRKLTPSGSTWNVTTLAGYAPMVGTNDGLGTNAHFAGPSSVAVDTNGFLYVSDFQASTIRRVGPDGAVATLAGGPGAHRRGLRPGPVLPAGASARIGRR